MTTGGDPFAPAPVDPPAFDGVIPQDAGPPISYGPPPVGSGPGFGGPPQPSLRPPLNTFAVLAPIFGVLVPPAGVAFGHLALPQIKRTGQRGWPAAICGLALGYLLSAVLVLVLVWLLATDDRGANSGAAAPSSARGAAPPPSVVTSVAPAPRRPHTKLDLDQATVGKCVEIQKRDEGGLEGDGVSGDEALDLYQVSCAHRVGVYTVIARVSTDSECNSTYVASPPDRSFAVCLNRY